MNQWKRLAFYLIINIFVSALTIWVVLIIWGRNSIPIHESSTTSNSMAGASSEAIVTPKTPVNNLASAIASTQFPPEQRVEEYQVEVNETLGEIAEQYGISVEELMEFNGLNNPNSLSAGMILYIPLPPENDVEPEITSTQLIALTSETQSAGGEVGRVLITSVIGTGDLSSERVFLTRTGSGMLLMAGWRLMDEDGNLFEFPILDMFEGGAVNVWSKAGSATVVDLYWGLPYSVWESGEMVVLVDAEGNLHANYRIP